MNIQALHHQAKSLYAYIYKKNEMILTFRASAEDDLNVYIWHGDKYEWDNKKKTAMEPFFSDGVFTYYRVTLTIPTYRLSYYFEVAGENEVRYFTEFGVKETMTKKDEELFIFHYPYLNQTDVHTPPEWVKDAIFYQIFPERFCNGDESLNPEGCLPWGSKPEPDNFMGGDLKGIISRMDYLAALGINCIYMTPVFASRSNHKYDTTDYMKIDPQFGTAEDLKELVDKAHEKGIRVLLDAVFNHSGVDFEPFQKALADNGSDYYNWFHFLADKVTPEDVAKLTAPDPEIRGTDGRIPFDKALYETFAHTPFMPKINTAHPAAREYFLQVGEYWVRECGIDGWRLDVSNEVDHRFWRDFADRIKAIDPEAYVIGEIWHDSTPWLQGDQYDAVMNYPIQYLCYKFFADRTMTAREFQRDFGKVLLRYTRQVNEVMMNLLDSHDTARFINSCQGDKRRSLLAFGFLSTIPGAPLLYYGTEIGLTGDQDPDCRKCMVWEEDQWDKETLEIIKGYLSLRNSESLLRRGDIRLVDAGDKLVAFERFDGDEALLVLLNNGEEIQSLPALEGYENARALFTTDSSTDQVPAYGLIVLKKN